MRCFKYVNRSCQSSSLTYLNTIYYLLCNYQTPRISTMAAEEERIITSPSQLQEADLSIGLSKLSIETGEPESQSQSPTRQVRLALLQPLATPAMLVACRNPSSTVVRFPDGRASDATGHEYLDISALRKAWVQAVGKVLPVSLITFDLSLPQPDGSVEGEGEGEGVAEGKGKRFRNVYWDTSTPSHGQHLAVLAPDVMRLAVSIATTTRMRVQGDLRFELVYNEKDGVSTRAMALLKKQLLAIAESSHPGLVGTQQAEII
ncbi:hypothetical protein BJ170DRAFT_638853 [Xylariales sp. AK1849]|nr:hypothetical protein BJ170DRAFT_638853 [Xylariales sp. AK1849]